MKKFNLLFILVLSVFLVFSCSSNDEEEELSDTDSSAVQDADNTGDTLPDGTENDDDTTDTAPENDDSDTSDSDTSDSGITDNDIPSGNDDSDTTPEQPDDTDPTEEPDDDADSDSTDDSDTGTNDDDQETIIPDIPVVFGNICTGQTKCYSETAEITCPDEGEPFFGQDAQYAKLGKCIPQKFTVKGSGDEKIVFDENLKLEWQQKITKNVDWQQASEECAKEYAGSYGWRLPTPKELLSIVDNSKFDPAINTDYFPDTNDEWFWTSADFKDTEQNQAWFVRFDKGFLSHKSKTESEKMHVRCVRGTTLPDGEFETQTIGGDKVVKDSVTGLMWQKTYEDSVKKFADALSTCEDLDYAGFTDWRLPNKNELASIANYAKYRPASDFPGMPNWTFRTSTTDTKTNSSAWYVIFSESIVNPYAKTNSDSVRCVRRSE